MNKYEIYLVKYISEKNSIDTKSIDMTNNIFENGYIDSIGIFTLFVEIEEEFNVDISLDNIETLDISTIEKLAKAIGSLK